jgi:hypothetical protein
MNDVTRGMIQRWRDEAQVLEVEANLLQSLADEKRDSAIFISRLADHWTEKKDQRATAELEADMSLNFDFEPGHTALEGDFDGFDFQSDERRDDEPD